MIYLDVFDVFNMEFEQKSEVLHCYELLSMQYLEQSQDEDIWQMLILWSQNQVSFDIILITF